MSLPPGMYHRDGKILIVRAPRCVGWKTWRPKTFWDHVCYHVFRLKYKTIWENSDGTRTTRKSLFDEVLRDTDEYS